MNKTTKIILIILMIAVAGFVIYFIWNLFTAPSEQQPSTTQQNATSTATTTKIISATRISKNPAAALITTSNYVFYIDFDGNAHKITTDNKDSTITAEGIQSLNSITISPDKQKILVSFGNPQSPQWAVFDANDQVWQPLPQNIIYSTWSNQNNLLICLIKRSDYSYDLSYLNISKSPFVFTKIISPFDMIDINFVWNYPNDLLIYNKPSYLFNSQVLDLNLKNQNIRTIYGPALGLTIQPANNFTSSSIIFGYSTHANAFTLITSSSAVINNPLPFITMPQKCTADLNNNIYCFAPQDIPSDLKLPDDYFQQAYLSSDQLYIIDNSGNLKINQLNTTNPIDGIWPQIFNNNLYFINRRDNFIYYYPLNP
ncbi:MAG: hypothetical protein ACP5IC_01285 [Minisyncoccia bacterium]